MTAGDPRQHYLDAFGLRPPPAAGEAWTGDLRRAALERFAALGFPTQRQEAWRRTSVLPIAEVPFLPEARGATNGLTPAAIERFTFEPWECSHIVFVNGHHAPALSRLRRLPPGARVMSLARALETERERVEPHLARHASFADRPFTALNTALMQDGAFIELDPGTALDEEIHLVFVSSPHGAPMIASPRTLIVAGAGSRAVIVESYVGVDSPHPGFTNAVTEIVTEGNASIEHYRLQRESPGAYHIATVQADLARDARLFSCNIALGSALARADIDVLLAGEGAECRLDGLYVGGGRQHLDSHTMIDHARPHCTSDELYKGVLDGRARGVFEGRIIVRPDAQKTDARQMNKNLLLSEEALVDSTPQLEIRADDVKCTHGATIGQIDEDAMFYLRSRAVGEEAARNLLIQAFVSDVVRRIGIAPIRAGLECLLFTRLHKSHAAEGAP